MMRYKRLFRVWFILAIAIQIGFFAPYSRAFTIPQSLVGGCLILSSSNNRQYYFTSAHYGYWIDKYGYQDAILYAYNVTGEDSASIPYSDGYIEGEGWKYENEITLNFTNSTSGSYVLVVAKNYGGITTSGTFQLSGITPPSLPNLTPYKPNGWSDKIVISNNMGTNTDDSPLLSTDSLFVDLAVINNGTSDVTTNFYIDLYIDGVKKQTWQVSSLEANYYIPISDYSIGRLPAGIHEIKIVSDATNVIAESNETDNSYTKTITVHGGTGVSPGILNLLLNE